jgi:hypothetical protein
LILRRVLADVSDQGGAYKPPLAVRMLGRFAFLRRIPARIIGLGVRPEHVRSPAVTA